MNKAMIADGFEILEKAYNSYIKEFGKEFDDYAVLESTIIKEFLKYGREDLENDMIECAKYVLFNLENIFDNLKKEVSKKERIFVDTAHTERPQIKKFSFVKKDGKPIIYVGYGHFGKVLEDLPLMQKLGCNIIQNELGPNCVVYPEGTHKKWGINDEDPFKYESRLLYRDGEFEINTVYFKRHVTALMKRAEESHVAVDFLISPHYMPQWVYEKYPQVKFDNNQWFIHYHAYEELPKRIIEAYLRAIIPILKEFKALNSICLTNEPMFDTSRAAEYYSPKWREELKLKYGNITALNGVLGTNYTDFDEIFIPTDDEKSPLYYEWSLWNDRLFADWHGWLAEIIHSMAPEIPLHAKTINLFGVREIQWHRNFIAAGTNPFDIAEVTQINGNDSLVFYPREHLPVTLELQWYDFLASAKKMPIFNSEDHVIEDWDNIFVPEQSNIVYTVLIQGALHGRSASTVWIWERSEDPTNVARGSVLYRPDCVEAVGRAGLDLNRISEEITSFQRKPANCGILYSVSARIYDIYFTSAMFRSYESVIFSGNKACFITDRNINDIYGLDFLVIPCMCSLPEKLLKAVERFVLDGGILIIADNGETLKYDEYKHPFNEERIKKLKENARIVTCVPQDELSYPENMTTNIKVQLDEVLKNEIRVVDAETLQPVERTEWGYTKNKDGYLINLCNYSWEQKKTVKILKNNVPVTESYDLLQRSNMGDTVVLNCHQPYILQIK